MIDAQSARPPMRRCTVTRTMQGWEVREEDCHVVRQTTYRDWHRVERAVARFERPHPEERSANR
jgi:hypothetical protein